MWECKRIAVKTKSGLYVVITVKMHHVDEGGPGDRVSAAAQQEVGHSQDTFHPDAHGQLIRFSNNGSSATRNHAAQEFNHGLVFSSTPLSGLACTNSSLLFVVNHGIFQLNIERIHRKINSLLHTFILIN